MNFATENLVFDPQIIRRFDINGPRYTSYPTADRFVEAFDAEAAKLWLGKRTIGGISRPLSLYFHIPFCNTICYYCACNKIITKDHGRCAKYLKYLAKEIALQSQALDGGNEVIQLHWGGGTPTFLSHDEMRQLMGETRKHFELLDGGEYSIEVDPRKVDTATVALLGELGFNRMSVGVQDFDRARAGRRQSSPERRRNRQRHRRGARQWLQVGFHRSDLRSAQAERHRFQPHARARARRSIPTACRSTTMRICPACSSRSAASPKPICRRPTPNCRSCAGDQEADRCRLCLHRHGPLRQARRRTGGCPAPGAPAPQFPGLFDLCRLRPAVVRHFVDRQGRTDLQPERQDAGRVLRSPRRQCSAGRFAASN